MEIRVLFFASCKDIVGYKEAEREIAEGTTVGDLMGDLQDQYPDLAGLRSLSLPARHRRATRATAEMAGDHGFRAGRGQSGRGAPRLWRR